MSFVPENCGTSPMHRVNSCYFSVTSVMSDEEEEFEEFSFNECFLSDNTSSSSSLINNTNSDDDTHNVDVLYHDVMMNIYSYLNAHDLVSLSCTAKRTNLECDLYLGFLLQSALSSSNHTNTHNNPYRDLLPKSIMRLAVLDYKQAHKIVDAFVHKQHNVVSNKQRTSTHTLLHNRQALKEMAQANPGSTGMMISMLLAASYMGSEPAQALLSMGMAAGVIMSGEDYIHNNKSFMTRRLPRMTLPDHAFESLFPQAVATRLKQFAEAHGMVRLKIFVEEHSHPGSNSSNQQNQQGLSSPNSNNIDYASKQDEKQIDDSDNQQEQKIKNIKHQHQHDPPTGSVGLYAKAIKKANASIRDIIRRKRRAKFDSYSEMEQDALHQRFFEACSSDSRLDEVKDLVRNCGVDGESLFMSTDDATETCGLHTASFHGSSKIIDFLCTGVHEHDSALDGGLCDVNARDENGWTALHFAAGSNQVSSVKILASHGANLTIEANNGYTPYHWAERLSNREVSEELKKLGADERFFELKKLMFSSLANRFFHFSAPLTEQLQEEEEEEEE